MLEIYWNRFLIVLCAIFAVVGNYMVASGVLSFLPFKLIFISMTVTFYRHARLDLVTYRLAYYGLEREYVGQIIQLSNG